MKFESFESMENFIRSDAIDISLDARTKIIESLCEITILYMAAHELYTVSVACNSTSNIIICNHISDSCTKVSDRLKSRLVAISDYSNNVAVIPDIKNMLHTIDNMKLAINEMCVIPNILPNSSDGIEPKSVINDIISDIYNTIISESNSNGIHNNYTNPFKNINPDNE